MIGAVGVLGLLGVVDTEPPPDDAPELHEELPPAEPDEPDAL